MKVVWALLALAFAVLALVSGYLMVASGAGQRLGQKGVLLQAPPILAGVLLIVFALALVWQGARLLVARRVR